MNAYLEYIGLIANLGALSVIGILYITYIKNLRSQIDLKNEQIRTSEQNLSLWKDKAMDLERQTPQYIEQVLAERIRIREEEIVRLAKDEKNHRAEIEQKNIEVSRLKKELEAAHEFGRGISIYDPKNNGLRQLSPSELTIKELGYIWLNSATLMICDPWHFSMSRELEMEEFPVLKHRFRNQKTGEIYYSESEDEPFFLEEFNKSLTIKELVEKGHLIRLSAPETLPADPDTYIKGERLSYGPPNRIKACTFYNGVYGAGLAIGTRGDGAYRVRGEFFEGEICRLLIDLR